MKKILIITSLSVMLFFVFACTNGPSSTSDTSSTSGTTYTVTLDSNGGVAPAKTSFTVNAGATFTLPADLPKKDNMEIAYWSEKQDDYTGNYDFSKAVNSNLTLFPHYRYTVAYVLSTLNGTWLWKKVTNLIDGATDSIYKIDTVNNVNQLFIYSYHTLTTSFTGNTDIINAVKNDTTCDGAVLNADQNYACFSSIGGQPLTIVLAGYADPSKDVISVTKFYGFTSASSTSVIKLNSADSITFTVLSSTVRESDSGDYSLTRIK